MYYCFRSLLFLITACLIATSRGDHRSNGHRCLESIQWNELLKDIEKLNVGGFSLDCKDVDNRDLCQPEEMIRRVRHSNAAIVQILHEIAKLFDTKEVPFPSTSIFVKGMYETRNQLKTCLQSKLFNISHVSTVKECFKTMNSFLIKSNHHCAWQEIHAQSRELLQRIENYSVRREPVH